MSECPREHYQTCGWCGVVWHLPHMELPYPRGVAYQCPDCRPPEPHCDTCTCHPGPLCGHPNHGSVDHNCAPFAIRDQLEWLKGLRQAASEPPVEPWLLAAIQARVAELSLDNGVSGG